MAFGENEKERQLLGITSKFEYNFDTKIKWKFSQVFFLQAFLTLLNTTPDWCFLFLSLHITSKPWLYMNSRYWRNFTFMNSRYWRHVGTWAREYAKYAGTWASQHAKHVGMWAREHARHVGTWNLSTQGTLTREHVST